MITLTKNSENNICVTLFELSTIESPRYLFEFKNKQKQTVYYCLAGDNLSTDISRIDEFLITEKEDPSFLNSEVNLSVGQYYYNVFQLSENQAENLSEPIDTSAYVLVEGPCQMKVIEDKVFNTFYSAAPVTNTVYEA